MIVAAQQAWSQPKLALKVVAQIGEATPDGWVLQPPSINYNGPLVRVTREGRVAFAMDADRADSEDRVEGVFITSPFEPAWRILGDDFLVLPPDTVYEARHPRFWDFQFDSAGVLVFRAELTPPGGFRQPERMPADFNSWTRHYAVGSPAADQNFDGRVTPGDFNAWIIQYTNGCN